jgi:hypothetical protein
MCAVSDGFFKNRKLEMFWGMKKGKVYSSGKTLA